MAFEGAFAELGLVGCRGGGRDGGEGGESRELKVGGDELAARGDELVHVGEQVGVLACPRRERGEGHVDAFGDVGECAGFEERGEDVVVARCGGVCVFHT